MGVLDRGLEDGEGLARTMRVDSGVGKCAAGGASWLESRTPGVDSACLARWTPPGIRREAVSRILSHVWL